MSNNLTPLTKSGNMQLSVEFNKQVDRDDINVLIFGEFQSQMTLDKDRHVGLTYTTGTAESKKKKK